MSENKKIAQELMAMINNGLVNVELYLSKRSGTNQSDDATMYRIEKWEEWKRQIEAALNEAEIRGVKRAICVLNRFEDFMASYPETFRSELRAEIEKMKGPKG